MVSTAGGIVIAIVVLVLLAAVGWVVFTQLRARRLGVSHSLYSVWEFYSADGLLYRCAIDGDLIMCYS